MENLEFQKENSALGHQAGAPTGDYGRSRAAANQEAEPNRTSGKAGVT